MQLEKGKFFGTYKKQFHINGLTVVDSEFYNYTHCPWHYHQHAHFALTTRGNLIETHKKKKLHLFAGYLIYNHSQEAHCNSGYAEEVAALHIDISNEWFAQYQINFSKIEGVHELNNPLLKNIFYKILKEVKQFDTASAISIETLVVNAVNETTRLNFFQPAIKPSWALKVKELLYDLYNEELSLQTIATLLNIHPVYLCQQFPAYFHCSFGEYIRKIRIEKAVQLMLNKKPNSLTGIAYACGFADQSHFIRTFKKNIGVTPLAFKKMLTD